MSSLLRARGPSKSTQTHTRRNKCMWGILERKSGGDEVCPRGPILQPSCVQWFWFLNPRQAMCEPLQHSLLECELKNLQERPNNEHPEYISNTQSVPSEVSQVICGFKIWGPTDSFTADTTIEWNWKFSDSTTLNTLREATCLLYTWNKLGAKPSLWNTIPPSTGSIMNNHKVWDTLDILLCLFW